MLLTIVYYSLFIGHLYCIIRNKKNQFLVYISLIVLGVMFYSNDASYGDHVTYYYDFIYKDRSNIGDPLYLEYMVLIGKLGIGSYQSFLLSIYLFEMFFIILGTLRFTKNFHAIFVISMLYIFPFFAVGLRYSMAISIFIFGLRFLFDKKIIYFLIVFILAACFHLCITPAFILLIYFYPKFITSKQFEKSNIPYFTFLIFIFLLVFSSYILGKFFLKDYLIFFLKGTVDERGVGYLDTQIANGIFIMFPAYVSSLFFAKEYLSLTKSFKRINIKEFELGKFVYVVNLLSSFFYLLYCVTPSFLRLLVLPSILNAFIMGRFIERRKQYVEINSSYRLLKFKAWFILMVLSWGIPIIFEMFDISAQKWIETTLQYYNK